MAMIPVGNDRYGIRRIPSVGTEGLNRLAEQVGEKGDGSGSQAARGQKRLLNAIPFVVVPDQTHLLEIPAFGDAFDDVVGVLLRIETAQVNIPEQRRPEPGEQRIMGELIRHGRRPLSKESTWKTVVWSVKILHSVRRGDSTGKQTILDRRDQESAVLSRCRVQNQTSDTHLS
ncbi:MAG: hypothetical protein ABSH20_10465 [Tepidisphaeraceae bacterium]